MPDTDVLVSELTQASAINTNDLMLMTQPDGESQTGYASRKGTVLQVATKVLKNTEYTTDLPNFDNKSVFGALNEIHNGTYIYKENETPYQLRQTPITANRTLEKLIGVSCAFNQLVQNGNFADTSGWSPYDSNKVSFSVSDNTAVISYLTSGGRYSMGLRTVLGKRSILGHKYLIMFDAKVTKAGEYAVDFDGSASEKSYIISTANAWEKFKIIANATNGNQVGFIIEPLVTVDNGDTTSVKNVVIIDLTACFGSEVADYLYTLESNTAGSGINLFRQLFPEDYYAYQTATLMSSKPVAKVIKDSNDQTIATYPLGGDELRGLLKVENGQLVAYGDIHPSDGNGTEVFDIVDLGTLDYSMDSTSLFRVTTDIGAKIQSSTSVVANMLCAEYMTVKQDSISNDKVISGLNWGKGVIIHDTDYTDVPTFKTAMSGKYLIYEKATPTAKSYTPFTNPMLCGSTEEFTDIRSLKMFCGHDSLYYTSNFKYW